MENQTEFSGWAVVEVMGHQTHIGFTQTQTFGTACMFRVDTPELPEREYELKRPEWIDGAGTCPAGTKVKREAAAAVSVLIGASSIYRITPCTEVVAREQIERHAARPLIVVSKPVAAIGAAAESDEIEDLDLDGDDVDDENESSLA